MRKVSELFEKIVVFWFSTMTILFVNVGVMCCCSCRINTFFPWLLLRFLYFFDNIFSVICVAFEQLLHTLFAEEKSILVLIFLLT